MSTKSKFASTRVTAEQLGVGIDTVHALIADGQLDAWPQRTPGGRVHAWKVSQQSIDSYPRRARLAAGI